MRVVTWNLFHGRSRDGAGRDLRPEFTAALEAMPWDVALLQECPPWWLGPARHPASQHRGPHQSSGWPPLLGADDQRTALTSRNSLLWLRRWLAERFPDVLKSEGGGANAILVRGERIVAHDVLEITVRPERRVAQRVELASGWHVVNMHCSQTGHGPEEELRRVVDWVGAREPVLLGGDLNQRRVALPGWAKVAERDVDALLVRGGRGKAPARRLDAGRLSDHPPLAVEVVRP